MQGMTSDLVDAVLKLNKTVEEIKDALQPKLRRSPVTCAVCGTLPSKSYYIEVYSEEKDVRDRIYLCKKDYEAMLIVMQKAHKELATKG